MINNISEGVLRTTTKIDPNTAIHEKQIQQQKVDQVRQARPVEKSGPDNKADTRNSENKQSFKFTQVEKTMVFEKYNENGDVVLRIPPSAKPVNEMA